MGCQYEEVPMDTETGDLTVNYSDLPIPERESTRLSIASSLLHEETSHDISVDNAFDVTRPDRSMVVEEAEMSLQDETVTDVPSSAGVTFEVIIPCLYKIMTFTHQPIHSLTLHSFIHSFIHS